MNKYLFFLIRASSKVFKISLDDILTRFEMESAKASFFELNKYELGVTASQYNS